jgi:hypothetical protein
MKITDVLKESSHDDWDDEDEVAPDPDQDTILHIVMQMKKALDLKGGYRITFKDGSKHHLPLKDIQAFMTRYNSLKPYEREKMQDIASRSLEDFYSVLGS